MAGHSAVVFPLLARTSQLRATDSPFLKPTSAVQELRHTRCSPAPKRQRVQVAQAAALGLEAPPAVPPYTLMSCSLLMPMPANLEARHACQRTEPLDAIQWGW